MTNPVPGYSVSTPYKKRGSHWSCDEDAQGNGVHTGVDYAAPHGTKVVAARGGTVNHCDHGSAFGEHQIDILAGDGTRDFYAHMSSRAKDGAKVKAGDKVGEVGAEGNVTGAHLHFERHATETGGWSCSVHRDPMLSVGDDEPDDWRASGDVYVSKLHQGQTESDSVGRLRYRLEHHWGMPENKRPGYGQGYGDAVVAAVMYWQRNLDPQAPSGPQDGTHMPNGQANRLFGDRYTVHEDEG